MPCVEFFYLGIWIGSPDKSNHKTLALKAFVIIKLSMGMTLILQPTSKHKETPQRDIKPIFFCV